VFLQSKVALRFFGIMWRLYGGAEQTQFFDRQYTYRENGDQIDTRPLHGKMFKVDSMQRGK
jgi:hypothetical protein